MLPSNTEPQPGSQDSVKEKPSQGSAGDPVAILKSLCSRNKKVSASCLASLSEKLECRVKRSLLRPSLWVEGGWGQSGCLAVLKQLDKDLETEDGLVPHVGGTAVTHSQTLELTLKVSEAMCEKGNWRWSHWREDKPTTPDHRIAQALPRSKVGRNTSL